MKLETKRLTKNILNLNESVQKRNCVAEYYIKNGISKTMEHFGLTKQGVYSDVRAYKKFISAYNLVSNVTTKEEFMELRTEEVAPLFNNPRVKKFFEDGLRLKDLNFVDKIEMRYKIGGLRSFNQIEEFVERHWDLIE